LLREYTKMDNILFFLINEEHRSKLYVDKMRMIINCK